MRVRFISLVERNLLPFAQVCARFGISRKTGYKWLQRFRAAGAVGLLERVRRPGQDPASPAAEQPAPNDSWVVRRGPTTVSAGLNHAAVVVQDEATSCVLAAEVVVERGGDGVGDLLRALFERHGLPRCVRLEEPDYDVAAEQTSGLTVTALMVELLRQGVEVERAETPPTAADAEPTLAAHLRRLPPVEGGAALRRLLRSATEAGAADAPLARPPQETLPRWRARLASWADRINHPDTAVADAGSSPAARYRPSHRCPVPAASAVPITDVDATRRVSEKGLIQFRGERFNLGRALASETVAVFPLPGEAGCARVEFAGVPLGLIRGGDRVASDPSEGWAHPLWPLDVTPLVARERVT